MYTEQLQYLNWERQRNLISLISKPHTNQISQDIIEDSFNVLQSQNTNFPIRFCSQCLLSVSSFITFVGNK